MDYYQLCYELGNQFSHLLDADVCCVGCFISTQMQPIDYMGLAYNASQIQINNGYPEYQLSFKLLYPVNVVTHLGSVYNKLREIEHYSGTFYISDICREPHDYQYTYNNFTWTMNTCDLGRCYSELKNFEWNQFSKQFDSDADDILS